MNAAQKNAIAQAKSLLGEHFEDFVIGVSFEQEGAETIAFAHGGSRLAALGLAVEAQYFMVEDDEPEDWRRQS